MREKIPTSGEMVQKVRNHLKNQFGTSAEIECKDCSIMHPPISVWFRVVEPLETCHQQGCGVRERSEGGWALNAVIEPGVYRLDKMRVGTTVHWVTGINQAGEFLRFTIGYPDYHMMDWRGIEKVEEDD